MSGPTVHVVVVDMTGGRVKPLRCITSVEKQRYGGKVVLDLVPFSPEDSGGSFLSMGQTWLRGGADFGCAITAGCIMPPTRLQDQVNKCLAEDLSACYGDAYEVNSSGHPMAKEEFRPFTAEMIGLETVPVEVLLFDLAKFRAAGGFDYMLAGSHKPDAYMVAMAACGGRIAKIDQIVLHRVLGAGHYGPGGSSPWAWNNRDSEDFWRRFQAEKFVRQAREHYASQGW